MKSCGGRERLLLSPALIVGDAEEFFGASDVIGTRLARLGQRIGDMEFFILRSRHGMIGQNLEALDVSEASGEACEAVERKRVVRKAGHEDVAQPYGLLFFGQIACEVEDILVASARERFMLLGIDVLDVEQHEVACRNGT